MTPGIPTRSPVAALLALAGAGALSAPLVKSRIRAEERKRVIADRDKDRPRFMRRFGRIVPMEVGSGRPEYRRANHEADAADGSFLTLAYRAENAAQLDELERSVASAAGMSSKVRRKIAKAIETRRAGFSATA